MSTDIIADAPDASGSLPVLASAADNAPPQQPENSLPAWAPALPALLELEDATAVDPRSLTLEQQMALADAPAARPADYKIPAYLDEDSPAEDFAEVQGIQSLLYAARLPAQEGSGLMETIRSELARHTEPFTDAQFEGLIQSTEYVLKRQLGDAEFASRQAKLGNLMSEIDRQTGGRLAEYIEAHAHILLQPLVYSRLLDHAARLDVRKRP